MTFSIVGYDPKTEEIGIAVQSKAFSVGSLVPFVKAEVGAVATQSLVNVSLGDLGLELIEEGKDFDEIIDVMREEDDGIEYRQLGFYSVNNGSFSFTGEECISYAGGSTGDNYAIQGNILAGPEVIDAMEDRFVNTDGELAYRLIAALEGGQSKGGDARGEQSAAIIIEQPGEGRAGFGNRKIDLRVEDSDQPIEELKRLVDLRYLNIRTQEIMVMASEDRQKAIDEMEKLVTKDEIKTNEEAWLTLATLYFGNDNEEKAEECVNKVLELQPGMINIITEYPRLGLGFDKEFVEQFE